MNRFNLKSPVWAYLALSSLLVSLFWGLPAQRFRSDWASALVISSPADSLEETTFIILFQEPPLASYRSGRGTPDKLDVYNQASFAYRDELRLRQSEHVSFLEKQIGRPLQIKQRYTIVANGIAAKLTAAEASLLVGAPGVRLISAEHMRRPLSDAGPVWIGAPGIWDGSNTAGAPGTQGEGIIIGIIDTGINMSHPSFADVGDDGYDHLNPYGPGTYVGLCATAPVTFHCNDKLIGAWSWPESGNNPEDDWGHGSNVASIAAGNVLTVAYRAPTIVLTPTLSGVAPHANLIAYDVCDAPGGNACPDSLSIAAIEQAVMDGVDVINFSIGGETVDPWTDPLALAFLEARQAGVFAVTAAGKGGPAPSTINSPANAPWITAVGNTTHHARFVNLLRGLSGGEAPPPADMAGASVTGAYGPAPIVYAGGTCENAFAIDTWTQDEIILCDYSPTPSQLIKAENVLAGGGAGIILAGNHDLRQLLRIDRLPIPGLQLLLADADVLRGWLSSGSGHQATIGGTVRVFDNSYGDELILTSPRGPAPLARDSLKPNLVAPGNYIWAASRASITASQPELAFYTGTSQSSAHVAGAAALLRALHGDWTVAEIESAIMTTAQNSSVRLADGTTAAPWETGAGRIDLSVAGRAGLVLPETAANFKAADPALGDRLSQLNLTGLVEDGCAALCSWTRQVRSTLEVTATWSVTTTHPPSVTLSVSPDRFVLAPGATQLITVTADVARLPAGMWDWGEVQLREQGGNVPDAHLPVIVRKRLTTFLPFMRKH